MEKLLMTPGPTNVPQQIREELSKDVLHHRMKDFKEILEETSQNLKNLFKTKNDVVILTSSGTGAMETSVVNLFSRKDKVLVINTGFFGNRFKEISEVYQLEVINLEYEWGTSYKIEDVEKIIKENKDLKGIFVTHSETSTGVLNNIENIGNLTKDTDILLVVDSISGMIVNNLEVDKWHIDCALAGSQKGFLLPPGLAFVVLSEKAKKATEKSDLPKYYFDLKKYFKYLTEKGENPYTPAISLIMGLSYACNYILEKGLDNIQAHHKELSEYLGEELVKLGFTHFIEDKENRGNTLVSVTHKSIENLNELRAEVDKKGISIAGGQGKYSGKLMRVGCLGEITLKEINETIAVIKSYINK